jgi:hypothetical protein
MIRHLFLTTIACVMLAGVRPEACIAADDGAWWSFQPVRKPTPPVVRDETWVRTPVDRFVLAKLDEHGLRPSPPADKRTLLRRVTFDLVGLPPTPTEIEAFVNDSSPQAFATVVDRLLASPRYGERWGRHWMDVVRYADTAGDNADYPVPEARLYRDYIIDAYNADKPYDEFVREQLAGDLLAADGLREKYAERIAATGFLALSRRYATAPFELMHLTIEDAIETTSRAFLGLSFRCARCHDHKFDPVTMEDYYGLFGIFASTRFPFAGSEEFQSKNFPRTGFVPLVPPDEAALLVAEHARRIESLRADIKRLEQEAGASANDAERKKQIDAELAPLRIELKRREKFGAPPDLPVAYAVSDDKPVDESIHKRGEPAQRGQVVKRRAPRFLAGDEPLSIPPGHSGRREFAAWLTRPDNPLTARVMVNRIWQHHFGQGLAAQPSNLGRRGDPPSHPELLDWLSAEFVERGWSVKAMHRVVVLSNAYQQASGCEGVRVKGFEEENSNEAPTQARLHTRTLTHSHQHTRALELDAANHRLWRQNRRRLDAEAIRDAILAVAGTLDLARPGPHPFPKFDDWNWTQHNPFKAVYDSRHRSVYLMRQRIQRHPYLALFDAPDANVSTDVRTSATVATQSLYLMNNPFVREQAAAFADRILAQTPDDARILFAIETTWGRRPEAAEVARALDYIARFAASATETGLAPDAAEREAWSSYARVLLTSNEFFYVE